MIKCLICGYETNNYLGPHLKSVHKITTKEYKSQFPDSEYSSEDYKRMMSERNKSLKMRNITSERNKSEKMRKAVSERNKNPEFIDKCKEGIKNSETWSEVHSKSCSERNKRLWKNENYRKRMSEVISCSQKVIMNTPERKLKSRNMMLERWSDPTFSSKMKDAPTRSWSYSNRGSIFVEKFGRTYKYKSQGELEFINICTEIDYVTDLIYEPIRIRYEDVHIYIPDFLVITPSEKYLVEIKFNNSPDEFKNKVNSAIEYCSNNKMKFCWIRRFKELTQIKDKGFEIAVCRSKIG